MATYLRDKGVREGDRLKIYSDAEGRLRVSHKKRRHGKDRKGLPPQQRPSKAKAARASRPSEEAMRTKGDASWASQPSEEAERREGIASGKAQTSEEEQRSEGIVCGESQPPVEPTRNPNNPAGIGRGGAPAAEKRPPSVPRGTASVAGSSAGQAREAAALGRARDEEEADEGVEVEVEVEEEALGLHGDARNLKVFPALTAANSVSNCEVVAVAAEQGSNPQRHNKSELALFSVGMLPCCFALARTAPFPSVHPACPGVVIQ